MSKLLEIDINRINYLMFEQTLYTGSLERTFEDPKKAQKYLDTFVIRDPHDALMLTSIVTGLLAMVPSPLSPVLFGISLAADLTDAGLYAYQGDKYTAGLLGALAIIPGHQLFKQLKNLKTLERVGIEEAKRLLQLESKNLGTALEKKTARQIAKELLDQAKQLTALTIKESAKKIITNISKKSLKFVLNFILFLFKGSAELLKQTVIIGGLVYTFDKIYLAAFSDDPKLMTARNNSGFKRLIDLVEGNEEDIKKQLLSNIQTKIEDQIKSGQAIAEYNGGEKANTDIIEKFRNELRDKSTKDTQTLTTPPSYQDVISKKINPTTNKPFTIHKGQKGKVIRQLQNDLLTLGYEHILTGMGSYELGNDGVFGEWTEETVKEFQSNNKLNVDGIVGFDTLNKIITMLKK